MATWLEETEPFELKPTITRKRIMQGLTPGQRKRLDTRKARHQIVSFRWMEHYHSRPPHEHAYLITESGVPYEPDCLRFCASGWPRARNAKSGRRMNGKKEWGRDRDAWGKPYVQDKSSRERMRLLEEWKRAALEANG